MEWAGRRSQRIARQASTRTPENVLFHFEIAGLPTRALAWVIDLLVMLAVISIASQIATALTLTLGQGAQVILLVATFLVQWWYGAFFEWRFGGRTLGKMAMGLRVIGQDGLPIGFLQAVIRNLIRIVDILPGTYLLGGIVTLLDHKGRRLGDVAAQTMVIKERSKKLPSSLSASMMPEAIEGIAGDSNMSVLARRIAPIERDTLVALVVRRERLPLDTRRQLFSRMSAHLCDRLHLTRPPHLSEEKFVLMMASSLLGESAG